MKVEWELIYKSEDKVTETWRAKVFGGWLIRDFQCIYVDNYNNTPGAGLAGAGTRDYSLSNAITFLNDPKHEWVID